MSEMGQRIVLDTNCLLQTLPAKSPYHVVLKDVFEGKICLCVSNEILYEYEEVITRESDRDIARNVVAAIVHNPHTIHREPFYKFHFIEADPDDNKFVDCVVTSRAKYIVINDAHFNILKTIPFPKIDIVRLDDFLKELKTL